VTTFVDLANDGGNTQAGFIPYALSYAQTLSQATQLPVDLILAEWIAEGAYSSGSVAAQCNNPGNAGPGTYCTELQTVYGACSHDSALYGAPDANTGIAQQGDILNNAYPEIPAAFAQSTLTTGGSSLHTWAVNHGYGGLQNGTYNAAYQWGVGGSCGVWASSQYILATGDPIGSQLIQLIFQDSLTSYDAIYVCT
jgi:hypothetical protein